MGYYVVHTSHLSVHIYFHGMTNVNIYRTKIKEKLAKKKTTRFHWYTSCTYYYMVLVSIQCTRPIHTLNINDVYMIQKHKNNI